MALTNPTQEVTPMEAAIAAQRVIDARTALANVKEMLKDAEDAFKAMNVETIELPDGTLVTRIDADRRSINAAALRVFLTAENFDRVTKVTVDHKAFDAAVELGLIHEDSVEIQAAITKTPYTAIRVTKGE